jgi:anthranilate phosphoribosyltransferase
MVIGEAIKKVIDGCDLTGPEAEAVLDEIMSGECRDSQIGALLAALRMKGETVDEVAGFARVMRRRAQRVAPRCAVDEELGGTEREALIDTCGTGGDTSGTFNISTATAFVVAGCGVRVAKHGNRSVSSQCGSADVVEALGVKIEVSPARIAECIDAVGIGFLHAPLLHGAMKHVAHVRRELGVRTIFNLLGPLTNPAGASTQVLGVYAQHLTELCASVLRRLGSRRCLVVHGNDGLDEITITGPTQVTELNQGELKTFSISPEDLGVNRASLKEIQGGDVTRNADIIRRILGGEEGPPRDVVMMNASAALVASSKARSFAEGMRLASESISTGAAFQKLERLIEFTNSPG